MSKTETRLLKSFLLFILIVAIAFFGVVLYQHQSALTVKATAGVSSDIKTNESVHESSVNANNADKKLILRITDNPDGTSNYMFFVDQRILFDKTLPPGASMSLPFNSWDPTDTYVFLEEHNSGAVDYLVLKASGEAFADGNNSIDVGAVWADKQMGYTIRTATGWASGTLLIIYTLRSDGSKGPAYWFEIPSTAILQLAG